MTCISKRMTSYVFWDMTISGWLINRQISYVCVYINMTHWPVVISVISVI